MKRNNAHLHYPRVIEWSDSDNCYVGTSPGLLLGGVHGESPLQVAKELEQAIVDAVDILESCGRSLPVSSSSREFSGRFVLRVPPSLHQMLTLRAAAQGMSLNGFCEQILRESANLSYVAEPAPVRYSKKKRVPT